MTHLMRLWGGLLLAVLMTACGGGGGSPGDTTTGTGPNAQPTITMELVDAAGARTTSVGSNQSAFVRATLRDGSGATVSGGVVKFGADASLISFVPATGTALTDSSGVATIQVTPASGSSAGAASITADAIVATKTAKTGTLGIQVVGSLNTPDALVPAAIELFASSSQLPSSPNSTVSFTVVVKDSQNRAMPGQTVTFTASSGNLIGALPSKQTGPAGEPVTSVSISPGSDRANRDILVTATAGSVKQTLTVVVSGTAVSIVGDSSVLLGATTTFTATLRDASGQAIPGATLTVSSRLGNALTPSQLLTDNLGTAKFTYKASNSGVDALTVQGLGTSATSSVSVSAEDFSFRSPAASTAVAIGANQAVSVRLLSGGAPVAGRAVTFSTTRGVVAPTSAVTDANGSASATVTSTTSGPGDVVARAGSSQALLPLVFVATTPATLVLQANPGAVFPNAVGSSTNRAVLQATVRDTSGNPVSGQIVNFTAVSDLSNGTISPGSGVTDASGMVSVQFIPGALTTATSGVVIRASVQGSSVTGSASLTVSGQALFISIATGNVISNLDPTTYRKQFSVYVTDATGAPAANRDIAISVLPTLYGKGVLAWNGNLWVYAAPTTWCPNEDANKNGILETGEDTNNNGRLTPGLPAVVAPASVTTSGNGFATFFVQYGENFVPWLDTEITARASVGGTESVQTQLFSLEGVSSDFTSETTPPQGVVSPFGVATSCTDQN